LAAEAAGLPGAAAAAAEVGDILRRPDEARARFAADRLATLAAAAALAGSAPPHVAEAFSRTRLAGPRRTIGANDLAGATDLLLERALPGI
ncbi:MAG TPA: DNA alkylation response protein, partial [Beijerinckiaceae bacterium]|nr:DNA alkylation response protein [Beijerinckiaceae bacterium]